MPFPKKIWIFLEFSTSRGPPGGQPLAAARRGPGRLVQRALRRAAPRGVGLPGRATPCGRNGATERPWNDDW